MEHFFTESLVGFAGDWHGDTKWALFAIEQFKRNGISTIYHLGDFGVWGGDDGAKYLRRLNNQLKYNGQLLLVTPGNHENYTMIDKWPVNEYGFQQRKDLTNIWVIPRGHVWMHNGVRMASMGGAASVDKDYRVVGKSWWAREEITESDLDNLRKNVREYGAVDILLTHDAPRESLQTVGKWDLPPHIEAYAAQQQGMITQAVDICDPDYILHGHWHQLLLREAEVALKPRIVVGLPNEGMWSNMAIGELDITLQRLDRLVAEDTTRRLL